MRNIFTFLLIIAMSSLLYADWGCGTYLELSPELSYGVHDNGPAWVELVPLRGAVQISDQSNISGVFGYAYEIDRDKKPLGTLNHYGWHIAAKFEHSLLKGSDMRFFYEINVGNRVSGAMNDINYLQTTNYQRFGIIWHILRII
jgi:hypothetical protein